jgi:DNA recombination protein RmuC
MLNTVLLILGIAAIAFIGVQVLLTLKKLQEPKKDDQAFLMLQKHLLEIEKGMKVQDRTLNEQLTRSQESMQKQFGMASKIIQEVTEKLTKLDDTNKQVVNFAEQMKSLENILKNPKQRGILGEFFLENMLSNVLPPSHFKMQYAFNDGEIVDAAIFVKGKVIPVDAKFSLENYNKIMEETNGTDRERLQKEFKSDLKKRIDETGKYVRPEEGTTDFAFMFIPADGLFYNLLVHKVGTLEINTEDLIQYAFSRRVILVSPMTFYAYLQTVLHALKSLEIEESARDIQKRVQDLGRHLNVYEDYMGKLGTHLGTAVSSYNHASKAFQMVDKDVMKITEGEAGGKITTVELSAPESFDAETSTVKIISKKVTLKTNV